MENKWYIEEFEKEKHNWSFLEETGDNSGYMDVDWGRVKSFLTSVAQKEREAGRLEGINSVVLERKDSECKLHSFMGSRYDSQICTDCMELRNWNAACEALEKIKSKLKE